MCKLLLSVVLVASLSLVYCAQSRVLYCYYGTWATYRTGDGTFNVSSVDPNICTHLAYAFAGINENGTVKILDPWLDLSAADGGGLDSFARFVALKTVNPELKTLLAIGGWNEGSAKYSVVANDPELRAVFVQSVVDILLAYGFDGLDLDWEYPNRRDSVYGEADIENFSQLLRELRAAFDVQGLLLVAAVSSVKSAASLSYDIAAISKSLDLVNVMTYDLYTAADNVTGHNSGLFRGLGDENVSRDDALTVEAAVDYWLSQGCPPEKLLIGIPLYGRTFNLSDASVNGLRAPVVGPGIAGPYTAEAGVIAYGEFCVELQVNASSWSVKYDSGARVPYAVRGRDWVSFDNPASVQIKAKYAVDKGLRGIMVWSIESDDFHGFCHGEANPLLNSIKAVLDNYTGQVYTTTASTPSTNNVCHKEGLNRNPKSCTSFYSCVVDQYGGFIPYLMNCPANLYYDEKLQVCNYPQNVKCRLG